MGIKYPDQWEEPPTLWDLMGIRKPWGQRRKLKARKMQRVPPVDLFESDVHARLELGSPAYRTAKNRSGLGYIETQAEMARMQGIMLNRLVTRRFHVTSEPTVIGAMILLGLLWGVLPLGLLVIGSLAERRVPVILLLIWGGAQPVDRTVRIVQRSKEHQPADQARGQAPFGAA